MIAPLKLVCLNGAQGTPAEVPLDRAVISIGRSANNVLVVDDDKVSRYHGELSIEGEEIVIRDLGSTNGIRVNGKKAATAKLGQGDVVGIGNTEFRVEPANGAEGDTDHPKPEAAQNPLKRMVFKAISSEENADRTVTRVAPVTPETQPSPPPPPPEPEPVAAPEPELKSAKRKKPSVGTMGWLLEPVESTSDAHDLAGCSYLQDWLEQRWLAFSQSTLRYPVSRPRAITAIGPSGCGKTHLWRHVAATQELGAVRVDLENLLPSPPDSWLIEAGQALAQLDQSPETLVVIDDLDRSLACLKSLGEAAKAASIALCALLTHWLRTRSSDSFVVITASSPRKLPPDLVRRGAAVTEVFWLDLPSAPDRARLLELFLTRYGVPAGTLGLDALALAAEGFSAAQLQQAVEDSLFAAIAQRRDVGDEHILRAIGGICSVATRLGAEVTDLRDWAARHARASSDRPEASA